MAKADSRRRRRASARLLHNSGREEIDLRLPDILSTRMIARSRLFAIEELELRFANGVRRTYERLPGFGRPAVMVVALNDANEVMLIREYAAGFHENQLTLPKGAAEAGESLEQAADRELKEEVGFGARRIEWMKQLNLSPGHMGFTIHVMLARDLYPERLPADEPEPPEVVPWAISRLDALVSRPDFAEARAIAALYLLRQRLASERSQGDAQ
jgi:ADP-ribose diphosphatase